MTPSFLDYYRCPEEFARFGATSELGQPAGFFRFGKGITCFGRCAGPVTQISDGDLPDARPLLECRDDEVILPFELNEVVENLRRERYASPEESSSLASLLIRKSYYAARPFLSVGVRKHFQRFHLRKRKTAEFPAWPVDMTVDALCSDVMSLLVRANGDQRIPFIWFWPNEYQGCVLMTHDVEHEEGRAFCAELMDIDERHGIRASFQVVPEERYAVSDSFLESIRSRGFELNVHDLNHDGNLFRSREEFQDRARKINEYSRRWHTEGFRSGGMYRNAEWSGAFQFDYDMSFPSAAHLEPQRGGCCTIMPYFLGELVELPLTMSQDYSLFHILGKHSLDLWKEELSSVVANNGLASFIVHPDYVIDRRERRVYEHLLQYLSELCGRAKLWQPLPRDVARWWRERSGMRIERTCDSWKVTGPGSERARLAFAQLEEGRLTYHVESVPCTESFA